MSGTLSVKDSLYVTKANNNPAGVGIECETGSMGYFVPTTLTDDRIYGLPNETGTLATREWHGYRVQSVIVDVVYSSGGYKDINISTAAGKKVYGVISVGAYGTRDNANFGIVNAAPDSYTISISLYGPQTGGGVPSQITTHRVQVWYLYDN